MDKAGAVEEELSTSSTEEVGDPELVGTEMEGSGVTELCKLVELSTGGT